MLIKILVANTLYFLWDTSSKGVQEPFACGTHSCPQNESKPSICVIWWMPQNRSGRLGVGDHSNWEVDFRESLALFSAAQPLHKVRWMELGPSCWTSLPRGQQLGALFWVDSDLRRKRYFSRNDAISAAQWIFASRWSRPLALQWRWLKQSLKGAALLLEGCSAEPCSQAGARLKLGCGWQWQSLLCLSCRRGDGRIGCRADLPIYSKDFYPCSHPWLFSCRLSLVPLPVHPLQLTLCLSIFQAYRSHLFLSIFIFSLNLSANCVL